VFLGRVALHANRDASHSRDLRDAETASLRAARSGPSATIRLSPQDDNAFF